LDALVFTGGVGEHAPAIRAGAADRLTFLGVAVDAARNGGCEGDGEIGGGAPVRVAVVSAREDVEMARETRALLSSQPS
jgi:acetate kinase